MKLTVELGMRDVGGEARVRDIAPARLDALLKGRQARAAELLGEGREAR
jgi:hypothetical protein